MPLRTSAKFSSALLAMAIVGLAGCGGGSVAPGIPVGPPGGGASLAEGPSDETVVLGEHLSPPSDAEVERDSAEAQSATAALDPAGVGPAPDTSLPCRGKPGSIYDPNTGTLTLTGASQTVSFPCFSDFTSFVAFKPNDAKGASVALESSTNEAVGGVVSPKCGTGTTVTACGTPIFYASLKPNKRVTFSGGSKTTLTTVLTSPTKIFQNYLYAASVYEPVFHRTIQTVNYLESTAENPHSIAFAIKPPNGEFFPIQAVVIVYLQRVPPAGTIHTYQLTTNTFNGVQLGYTGGIGAGPDGNVWFTEVGPNESHNFIVKTTPSGKMTPYGPLNGVTTDIKAGPDGNLWFTESYAGIGRSTTNGTITQVSEAYGVGPYCIGLGPDDNMWFAYNGNLGRIAPSTLQITNSLTSTGLTSGGIALGPDGDMWVTPNNATIGKLSVSTSIVPITEYRLRSAVNGGGIAAGADGNVWFTEPDANKVAKVTRTGVVREYSLPATSSNSKPWGIAAGPDGNLWFTEQSGGRIGRITTGGVITEFPAPGNSPSPTAITAGPDGNMWYTDINDNLVGKISV